MESECCERPREMGKPPKPRALRNSDAQNIRLGECCSFCLTPSFSYPTSVLPRFSLFPVNPTFWPGRPVCMLSTSPSRFCFISRLPVLLVICFLQIHFTWVFFTWDSAIIPTKHDVNVPAILPLSNAPQIKNIIIKKSCLNHLKLSCIRPSYACNKLENDTLE